VQVLNRDIEVVLVDPDLEHRTPVPAGAEDAAGSAMDCYLPDSTSLEGPSLADLPTGQIAVSAANPNRRPQGRRPRGVPSAAALMQAGTKAEVRNTMCCTPCSAATCSCLLCDA
jgi:hypothetical protein